MGLHVSDTIYQVTVEGPFQGRGRQQLLNITGERATVIEAALRVILDCGQDWQEQQQWASPAFEVKVSKIK